MIVWKMCKRDLEKYVNNYFGNVKGLFFGDFGYFFCIA